MSLQGPTFVASIAAKLVLCATQWMEVKKEFTFSFKRAATPFYLPIIVNAPSEPNPTYLSKPSLHSFMFFISVLNIIHASFFHSSICNNPRKTQKENPSSTKIGKNNKITCYGYIRGLINHNTKKLSVSNPIQYFFWTTDEMQNKISPRLFSSWCLILHHVAGKVDRSSRTVANYLFSYFMKVWCDTRTMESNLAIESRRS